MRYRVETVSVPTVRDLCDLQNQYSREVFQYNGEMEQGFYLDFPPLEGGKNVFCVWDSRNKMIGYSMVFRPLLDEGSPEDVDYEIWCDLTILPPFQDKQEVKDLLYGKSLDAHFQSEDWTVGTLICVFTPEGDIAAGIKVHAMKEGQNDERTGVLDSIFTLPGWRGRGYAKTLIKEAHRFLYEKGIRKSSLEVSTVNVEALHLYAVLGYKVVREKIILMKAL